MIGNRLTLFILLTFSILVKLWLPLHVFFYFFKIFFLTFFSLISKRMIFSNHIRILLKLLKELFMTIWKLSILDFSDVSYFVLVFLNRMLKHWMWVSPINRVSRSVIVIKGLFKFLILCIFCRISLICVQLHIKHCFWSKHEWLLIQYTI